METDRRARMEEMKEKRGVGDGCRVWSCNKGRKRTEWEDGAKDGRERSGDVGMRALEIAIKWRGVSW